jgi:methionyl aminopeptidase
MTEKQYGGATGRGTDKASNASNKSPITPNKPKEKTISTVQDAEVDNSSTETKENFLKAGKIASEVVKYAREFIKRDMPLLEIANKIEDKITELGAKPAFPVNLSIDETAAHDTPAFNDTRVASGLLKVDIGAHIEGCIADIAFSLDLDNNDENKKLIKAAEDALKNACEKINEGVFIREVGAVIEKTIKSFSFEPIHNLSGHSIEPWSLHSGITVPNHDNSRDILIEPGVYAIEPFATTGLGTVRDGKPSGIYRIEREFPVRDAFAREVLAFIYEEYKTLPFCSRWIQKRFGSRGLLALRRIEEAGIVHHYPQLIESSGKKVSQAEHTLLIDKDKKKIITTE